MRTNEEILQSMRMMAWHRAVGELYSINNASYGRTEESKLFQELLFKFVKDVESNGLLEGV